MVGLCEAAAIRSASGVSVESIPHGYELATSVAKDLATVPCPSSAPDELELLPPQEARACDRISATLPVADPCLALHGDLPAAHW